MRARFSGFVLDTETRELRRGDERLHLSKKAFDLLTLLVEACPRAVLKREILDAVWPETFVSDTTVAAVVAELRGALGDDAREPRFVRTIHGIGYAFCGDLRQNEQDVEGEDGVHCRLIWGEREIALTVGENLLGRDREALSWIDDPSISRRHALIVIAGETATIEDLGSKNGTFVEGERLRGRRALLDGNRIILGQVALTFRLYRDALPTDTIGI